MIFCFILGTFLGFVSMILGVQWYRRGACRGRWEAWPLRMTQSLGMGRLGGTVIPAYCRPSLSWSLPYMLGVTRSLQ